MAMYTVPADKVAIVGEFFANSGRSGEITVDSFVREPGGVFRIKRRIGLFESSFTIPNTFPFMNGPMEDIEIRATSSIGTPVSAGFDVLLVDRNKAFGI